MSKCAAVALILLLCDSSAFNAQAARRDGNWWLSFQDGSRAKNEEGDMLRTTYALGMLDGLLVGSTFLNSLDDPTATAEDIEAAKRVNRKSLSKYVTNITAGQLRDGLDSFYKDYRNRRITTDAASFLVLASIAGTPEELLTILTETARRRASEQ